MFFKEINKNNPDTLNIINIKIHFLNEYRWLNGSDINSNSRVIFCLHQHTVWENKQYFNKYEIATFGKSWEY